MCYIATVRQKDNIRKIKKQDFLFIKELSMCTSTNARRKAVYMYIHARPRMICVDAKRRYLARAMIQALGQDMENRRPCSEIVNQITPPNTKTNYFYFSLLLEH